jgi:hypothetical protein
LRGRVQLAALPGAPYLRRPGTRPPSTTRDAHALETLERVVEGGDSPLRRSAMDNDSDEVFAAGAQLPKLRELKPVSEEWLEGLRGLKELEPMPHAMNTYEYGACMCAFCGTQVGTRILALRTQNSELRTVCSYFCGSSQQGVGAPVVLCFRRTTGGPSAAHASGASTHGVCARLS